MKKIIIFLLLITGVIGKAQIPSDKIILTPNGYFDKVFDRFGNQYELKDLEVGKDQIKDNNTSRTTTISCNPGIFELYFETNSGMENTSNPIHNQRREVLCRVLKDISDFIIDAPIKDPTNTTKVRLWIRNIDNLNAPSNALGTGTSFYTMPYNPVVNFGGIIDGEVYKTIHGGIDSYTSTAVPLIDSDGSTASSGKFYHGMMSINFDSPSWNLNMLSTTETGEYDLYSIILHEITHVLGFNSLIKKNGQSVFGLGYQYYSRYDLHIKDNLNNQYVISNSDSCSSMYNYDYNEGTLTANASNCTTNQTICSNALKFVGTNTIPVYTPNCFEEGSSFSHFEDLCISPPNNGNDTYFAMSNKQNSGNEYTKRFLKPEERNALIDIGYTLNFIYGDENFVLNSYNNYGSNTTGSYTAGVNDGISPTGTFSFIGNTNTQIAITNIILNDHNAASFECLEDVYDTTATFSERTGNASTTINFSSTVSGLHLLRYIPVNLDEKKGNITYIYVYVIENGSCAIPSTCNLVLNGDFEQHNETLVNSMSQFHNTACGWSSTRLYGSNEYFHSDLTTPAPNGVNLNVPCNNLGFETDQRNGRAYAGMYVMTNRSGYSESIRTKLKTPLLPNTKYILNMDISLAESTSNVAVKFQGYLSKTFIFQSGNSYIPISNQSMLKTSPVYSTITNGWHTVSLEFTTDSTGGEEYLYLGVLTNQAGPDINIIPVTPINGCGTIAYLQRQPYYFVDNVSLIPSHGAGLNLPANICANSTLQNLVNYTSSCPSNGIFSGHGITNLGSSFTFDASQAGSGLHQINYTYINSENCLITISDTIYVDPILLPNFTATAPICTGTTLNPLPTTSTNAITGTWSPPLNNTMTTTYTFTPNSGQCATSTSLTITVLNSNDPSCSNNLCVENLTLTNPEPSTNNYAHTYNTSSWIVCNNNYDVNGQNITLNAQTSIDLAPNTYIHGNSTFLARIEDCPENVNKKAIREKDEDNIGSSILIYPNPTNDYITITSEDKYMKNIEIISIDGKSFYSNNNFKDKKQLIDLSKYQNGIYIIRIETEDNKTINRKIVKN
ncbi:T9SS type A sorting domain-containing protein [Flavobacterium amniphilum]|uniref:T9SS type A sorting domain-containing protein n=1 Tax=Flavobacterium amniphilum TaxID=1834035 RepID=UPI002029FB64|nr:T9SS type A sorting domain-containing protein [Flavobacterium amniphilum]MCL9806059.1 T9SS type A sorting domain-containing protein [Flavobacterium amniphilum]